MIAAGSLKQGGTKKIRCPYCAWRLCDAAISEPDYVITVDSDCGGQFILKCRKCRRQIGLALILT